MNGPGAPTVPHGGAAFQGQAAGLVSRSLAAVLDGLVVATLLLFAYVGVSVFLFALHPRSFSFPAPAGLFTIAAFGVVATLYLTVGWWISGRTYGCAVMGLRVVGRDDRDVRFGSALLRAAVCVLFPIGLGWCALDRRDRALHDLLARTRVIYDWRGREH